jgi:carboxynorspermidine decarboxylase
MGLVTPYYLIDEKKLLRNLKLIEKARKVSGTKFVLALKCFSTWSVFNLMSKYMDGTTSSSLYETRLGKEKFGKETHAYCVGYSDDDIRQIVKYADKIIFNSVSQLKKYHSKCKNKKIGLRINPKISYSHFDLADPARKFSRLGVVDKHELESVVHLISGVMFHFNCENDNYKNFSDNIDHLTKSYGHILNKLDWISLGGGVYFTKPGYPFDKFCDKLKQFSNKFNIQVYMEPGETAITRSAELVTKVVDVVHNEIDIAIVDASTEAHMLDLLIYRCDAKIDTAVTTGHRYMIAGRSCLAGDVFGTYNFKSRLKPGSIIKISDAAGYSMVKKNWFNGLQMPAIAVKRLNGKTVLARKFDYTDFVNNL